MGNTEVIIETGHIFFRENFNNQGKKSVRHRHDEHFYTKVIYKSFWHYHY